MDTTEDSTSFLTTLETIFNKQLEDWTEERAIEYIITRFKHEVSTIYNLLMNPLPDDDDDDI